MAFLGTILQEVVKFKKARRERRVRYNAHLQDRTLKQLVKKASNTAFGKEYGFGRILKSGGDLKTAFANQVPLFTYNQMHDQWWYRSLRDESNIAWPGKIKYFALTSGTSGAPSKRIPVSADMIANQRKTSIRQMLSLYDLKMPKELYQKQILMLGGSTALTRVNNHFEGDLSGILATRVPRWFYRFRKPDKKVAAIKNWEDKLDAIAEKAPKWDIGVAAGIPAWMQILFERIIERHQVKSIHDIWPNLSIYVHGGVAFAPYKESISKLMGKPMHYMDTYLASEGFFAFENAHSDGTMQLVLDKGIYFEFIPFNDSNFHPDGELKENPEVLNVHQVKQNVNYALVISTCAGIWRYIIGDTVKFTDVELFEIIITGRTKHFLSLCGEHLSVDNMNRAVELTSNQLGITINEFTVSGVPYQGMFAHHWFLAVDHPVNREKLKEVLDHHLKALNDDYAVERKHALKDIIIDTLPLANFYSFMESKGKLGGQSKFPRVMNKTQFAEWIDYNRDKIHK
jgi:hypothetical protein